MESRKAGVNFVFMTLTLDMLALGLTAPVLPKLFLNFVGGDPSNASRMLGVFATVFALVQFLFSPMLGVLSDRVGRRPVILLSSLGLGLDHIVMALAPTIGWLFVGRAISAITAASTTGMAYVADVVGPKKRAAAFGMVGAAFGLGVIIGPSVGGLLGNSDPRLPFWVIGALGLANAFCGFFVLPESLPPEKRKAFVLRRANPLGSLVLLNSHPELFRLALIQFVGYVAREVFNVWALYTIFRYGWRERTIGLSLALVGICSIVVSTWLVPVTVSGLGERRTLYSGLFCGALGMVCAGVATTSLFFFLAIPVMTIWAIWSPAAQGMMTRLVSDSEQGELQGAIGSLASLARIFGPSLFTFTFAYFIDPVRGWKLPGAPWYLGAALLCIAMLMAMRMHNSLNSRSMVAPRSPTEASGNRDRRCGQQLPVDTIPWPYSRTRDVRAKRLFAETDSGDV